MHLPFFLVIGAAKSGTTTLYEYLCRHPQIFMTTPKEPEFFARDENYARGIKWYASLFADSRPGQVCGEASTIYTRSPQFPNSPARIAEHVPDTKLIYIMRNPVDRAYSHYVQSIKTAQNTRKQLEVQESFEEWNNRDPTFLDSSNYLLQIECYLDFFPRQSFLFLLMEDLLNNLPVTLARICRFLEIDSTFDLIQNSPIAANQASDHTDWFLRSRMTAPFRSIPGVARLAALMPQEARDRVYRLMTQLPYRTYVEKKYVPAPMLPETRQQLLDWYREPNRKLAKFLGLDLSHWNE